MSISPTLTVHELVRSEPAAVPVLGAAGIDTCCEGGLTLAEAAQGVGLTFDQLAAGLQRGIDGGASMPIAPSCGCERQAG